MVLVVMAVVIEFLWYVANKKYFEYVSSEFNSVFNKKSSKLPSITIGAILYWPIELQHLISRKETIWYGIPALVVWILLGSIAIQFFFPTLSILIKLAMLFGVSLLWWFISLIMAFVAAIRRHIARGI